MMKHDANWKKIIHIYPDQFLQLFFPDIVNQLDLTNIEFLESEMILDVKKGEKVMPDLLLRLHAKDGSMQIIIIHIEIQARSTKVMPARMNRYYHYIKATFDCNIIPVVLVLRGGRRGLVRRRVDDKPLGLLTASYYYNEICVSKLSAPQYIARGMALASTLAALMQPDGLEPWELKSRSMLNVSRESKDEAVGELLMYTIHRYLLLNIESEKKFRESIISSGEVKTMEKLSEWETKIAKEAKQAGVQEGVREGVRQGVRQGLEQGLEKGRSQEARILILRLGTKRFGKPTRKILKLIKSISTLEILEDLAERVFEAETWEEFLR